MLVHHGRRVPRVVSEHDARRRDILSPGRSCTCPADHRRLAVVAGALAVVLITASRVPRVLLVAQQSQVAVPRRTVVVRVLLVVLLLLLLLLLVVGVRVMTIRVSVAGDALVAQVWRVWT